jgi:hypothetical protein
MSKRILYIIAILFLILIGLSSRMISMIPEETGDGLWAMALFCFLRFLFINQKLERIAIATLAISFAVEFSQLIRWEWLVAFRSTFIGHMLLGQGFVWWDLLAYIIGVLLAYLIARLSEVVRS